MNASELDRWRDENPELHERSIELAKSAPSLSERQRSLIAAMVRRVRKQLIEEGDEACRAS